MPNYTTNYNLEKPLHEEFYNVDVFNGNADIIDGELKKNANNLSQAQEDITKHLADLVKHGVYGIATGTNTLAMTLENVPSYPTGMLVAFKNTTANTGAVTLNINKLGAKSIRKANGNTLNAGNLKAGGVYQCRYDGVNFYLLGEGGEYGNVTPEDVVLGKIFGTENGLMTGIATIQSLGGKRKVSGYTSLSLNTNLTVTLSSGVRGTADNSVTISNIGFRPSVLIVFGSDYPYNQSALIPFTMYIEEGFGDIRANTRVGSITVNTSNGQYPTGQGGTGRFYDLRSNDTQCGVFDGSAILPLDQSLSVYSKLGMRWIAYE